MLKWLTSNRGGLPYGRTIKSIILLPSEWKRVKVIKLTLRKYPRYLGSLWPSCEIFFIFFSKRLMAHNLFFLPRVQCVLSIEQLKRRTQHHLSLFIHLQRGGSFFAGISGKAAWVLRAFSPCLNSLKGDWILFKEQTQTYLRSAHSRSIVSLVCLTSDLKLFNVIYLTPREPLRVN